MGQNGDMKEQDQKEQRIYEIESELRSIPRAMLGNGTVARIWREKQRELARLRQEVSK